VKDGPESVGTMRDMTLQSLLNYLVEDCYESVVKVVSLITCTVIATKRDNNLLLG